MRSAVVERAPSLERRHPPGRDRLAGDGRAGPGRHERDRRRGRRRDRAVDRAPHRRARAPPHERRRAPAGPGHRRRAPRARRGRAVGLRASTSCWSPPWAPTSCCPTPRRWSRCDLGAHSAGAMDVGAACTGFLSALSLAAAQVECGRCEHVLVIGADVLSRFTDPSDRGTAALFADGAGAVVVGAADGGPGLIGHIALHADGTGAAGDLRHARRDRSSTCRATTPSRPPCTACPSRRSRPLSAWGLTSTTSACSSTTRPTPASSRPSASGSESIASA